MGTGQVRRIGEAQGQDGGAPAQARNLGDALAAAQEEAKQAQEAGGGTEGAAKVSQLMTEGSQVLTVLEGMEKYRLELESEAFGKAPAKINRGSPY